MTTLHQDLPRPEKEGAEREEFKCPRCDGFGMYFPKDYDVEYCFACLRRGEEGARAPSV